MNTSKEDDLKKKTQAAKEKSDLKGAAQNPKPETDENPEDFTQAELDAMENNLPAVQSENPADMQAIFDTLEGAENFRELTAQYLDLNKFEAGVAVPFIFTGKTSFTTDKKDVEGNYIVKDAVTLLNKEGESLICASTVIVNSLFKIEQIPAGIKIQVNGKKKGKAGDYFDCKVYVM